MSLSKPVVCHIAIMHGPFDVRVFHKECAALVEAGYEVHLVVPHDRDEVVGGVHIHALPQSSSRLEKIFLYPWLAYGKLLSLRPRPTICHFHDPETLPVGMALRLKGFKVIYDVRENQADQILTKEYIPRFLQRPVSWAYRFTEAITASGLATVHVLESIAGNYRQPKVVVRNLPKLEVLPDVELSTNRSRPRLIYVGGIARIRGAITMIDLARELDHRKIDFEMRLVGPVQETGLKDEMYTTIEEAGLAERVAVVGKVSFEQAQTEVASADVGLCLLHPVPNYLNSLAVKIFEYMRFGLPVIASDFQCWREYVTEIGSGVQVDVGCVGKIADAVEQLLSDPDRMREMGSRGREAVETRYCWEKEKDKLLDFYQRLLRNR